MRDGKQLVLTAKNAKQVAALITAGGQVVLVRSLRTIVYIMPDDVVRAPGTAHLADCPDCEHGSDGGEPCLKCDGTGTVVWHACPGCGDLGWQYTEGRVRMACRACRMDWSADHPGWLAQRLPAAMAVAG